MNGENSANENKTSKVLSTNKIKPGEFPEMITGPVEMETNIIPKVVTTSDYKNLADNTKRKKLMEKRKLIKKQIEAEREKKREEKLRAIEKELTKPEPETTLEKKKSPGRPKKTEEKE